MSTNTYANDIIVPCREGVLTKNSRARRMYNATTASLLAATALFWSGSQAADLTEVDAATEAAPAFGEGFVATVSPDAFEAPKVYRSRLEQIAAEQGDVVAAPAVLFDEPRMRPTVRPVLNEPRMRPTVQPAVVRTWTTPDPVLPIRAPTRSGAAPDVFGSVALSIGRTPMDAKWQSVSHTPVSTSVAGEILSNIRGDSAPAQLQKVNAWVNRRIAFTDDIRSGASDTWSNANDSLRRGEGDCEDYAIAKLQILLAAGYDERDLYLVIVRDLVRRAEHAVLVVRMDEGFVVLDSNTDLIVAAEAAHDYRPLMSFSGGKSWVHGYRTTPQPQIMLASTEPDAD